MSEIEKLEQANVHLFDRLDPDQIALVKHWLECLEDYYNEHVDDESRFCEVPIRHLSMIEEGILNVSGSENLIAD